MSYRLTGPPSMVRKSDKEKEKRLAELREELKKAEKDFEVAKKEIAAALERFPKFTEEETARAKEILHEQAELYPDRPISKGLCEEHGEYSAEDKDVYARQQASMGIQMGILAASFRVEGIRSQIFILEHEEDIFRWKRENKIREDRDFISIGDYAEYVEYLKSLSANKLYRSALGLELNKFPDGRRRKKVRQMTLGEMSLLEEEGVRVEGLQDLTVSEQKAIYALQKLLDETSYEGNLPGSPSSSEHFNGMLPRLQMTPTEYLEAYGVERRNSDNRLGGGARDAALSALYDLQKERILVVHTGFGKKRKAFRWKGPLISIERVEQYEDYTEEELEEIKAGSDNVTPRAARLVVSFSSLFVIGIENFYVLKPAGYYREIEEAYGTKRPPSAGPKLIDYLLTLNMPKHSINRDALIEKLGLEIYRDTRQKKRLEGILQKALSVALNLEYLKDYSEELGVFHLTLNPERCKRIGAKRSAKNSRLPQ